MSRVAVVTGGTRGIGEAISVALKKAGYKVAANYCGNDDRARAFTERTGIKAYKWDVADFDACVAGVKQIESELGPVDVIVNNAGITRDAIADTLMTIAGFAPGTEIVIDTMLPAEHRDEAGQLYIDLLAPAFAERGEALLSFLAPEEVADLLTECGYETIEQVTQRESVDPTLWDRSDALHPAEISLLTHARRK